ncbi:unnamed protein product [Prorocentrum cordatum]|uniref:Peptide-O-fucosyltransferase 1 n=1 Tax=Prorocentrum cordatum TaxID=2364126 RepID=A0ABN9VT35_9DINO|nr:unnamed protein product [Polarella glacialis]
MEGTGADDRVLVWQCLDADFCAGVGDQARGIAAALYTAMLSGRILFVRWSRHGQDVTSIFGKRAVDWQLPDSLLEECGGATWVSDNSKGELMRRAKSPDRCVAVTTNQPPELELAAVEPAGQGCIEIPLDLPFEHYVGCAMNFLFDFTQSYETLAAALDKEQSSSSPGTPRLVGLDAAPRQYVAVHLRFGDRVFNGDDAPDAMMVADALRCAGAAGRELFGPEDDDWGIFFASDSANARALALGQGRGGPPVFASGAPPVHSDYTKDAGLDRIWGVWGDQLLLARAKGLVQCMDMDRRCDVSGYSQLAAQVALMPAENVWVALSEGCARGGDVTMNSWFDRAIQVDGCAGYVSLLREALSIGQDTPQERKDEINREIAAVAEHSGAVGWGDLGE